MSSESMKNAWQLNNRNGVQQNKYLMDNSVLADCAFIVGEVPFTMRFECHKLLLAKASPIFEDMLYKHSCKKEDIVLADVDPKTFQIVLDYLYLGSYKNVDFDTAMQLYCLADKYMIQPLHEEASKNMLRQLSPETAVHIYETALPINNFDFDLLEQAAWKMILEHTSDVLGTEGFLDAASTTVLSIVKQNVLNIEESKLIEACENWAEKQVEKKKLTNDAAGLRTALGSIFSYFRFLTIDTNTLNFKSLMKGDLEKIQNPSLNIYDKEFCSSIVPRGMPFINTEVFTFKYQHHRKEHQFQIEACPCGSAQIIFGSSFAAFKVNCVMFLLGFSVPHCKNYGGIWKVFVENNEKSEYFHDGTLFYEDNNEIGNTSTVIKFEYPILLTRNCMYRISVTYHHNCHRNTLLPVTAMSKDIRRNECQQQSPDTTFLKSYIFSKIY